VWENHHLLIDDIQEFNRGLPKTPASLSYLPPLKYPLKKKFFLINKLDSKKNFVVSISRFFLSPSGEFLFFPPNYIKLFKMSDAIFAIFGAIPIVDFWTGKL